MVRKHIGGIAMRRKETAKRNLLAKEVKQNKIYKPQRIEGKKHEVYPFDNRCEYGDCDDCMCSYERSALASD
jgi:hypothetical protein